MEETTEEDISATDVANFGNQSGNDTSGYFANYSDDISEEMDMLQKFYDTFGQENNYALVGLYSPVIPIAIIANILVIVVIFKNDYIRSPANYLVVNLSVADLLVTSLCMPMAITQAISIVGLYKEIICKLVFYLQGVAVAASMLTIMVMSFDRYMAIKHPIAFRRSFNQRRMCTVIFTIWLASFVTFGPIFKAVRVRHLDEHKLTIRKPIGGGKFRIFVFVPPAIPVCFEDLKSLGIDPSYFGVTCFLLVYAIPVSIILVMYILMGRTLYTSNPPLDADRIEGSASLQQRFRLVRERKRVAWILLIIAILFILCWFPYNVLRVLLDLGFFARKKWVPDTLSYCLFFGHVNSMLNPLVYCSMTRTFRHSIFEILCHWRCGTTQRNPRRNGLVGGYACSTGARTLISSSQKTNHSAGKLHRSSSALVEPMHTRRATTSTTCDSSNSQHSLHQRCRTFNTNAQSPKLMAALKETRSCSQNDLANLRDLSHTQTRKNSLNGNVTLDKRPGEIRSNTQSE